MMKRLLPILILIILPGLLSGQDEAPDRRPNRDLLEAAGMAYIDGFYIDIYEYPNQKGVMPRVGVSWEEARSLCTQRGKRLCTGSEWRAACAGPDNFLYGYGAEFESGRCNTPYLSGEEWKRDRDTLPSGSFAECASDYGVFDMIGNVWEWTSDRYSAERDWRIVRGGSWFHNVNMARSDFRYGRYLTPDYRLDLIGFRCCRSDSPSPVETAP